jgi:hypothetical protein
MVQATDMNLVDLSDTDRWYVTNGVVAVGPVAFDLVTRGIAQGRIPLGSFVRHESWKVWRRLEDIETLTTAAREEAITKLRSLSVEAEERASSPYNAPPPPPSAKELESTSEREIGPISTIRPVPVDPVRVFGNARDLDDAFLLALSTAVTASSAHVGLLHRVRDDLAATVTAYAHGPGAELLLGERLSSDDPSLLAAQVGATIMGELRLGEAGRYIAGRVSRCIGAPRGVAMVPMRLHGRLVAMIEVGRQLSPFKAREVARVEDVIVALVERVVVMGWLE